MCIYMCMCIYTYIHIVINIITTVYVYVRRVSEWAAGVLHELQGQAPRGVELDGPRRARAGWRPISAKSTIRKQETTLLWLGQSERERDGEISSAGTPVAMGCVLVQSFESLGIAAATARPPPAPGRRPGPLLGRVRDCHTTP